MPVPVNVARSHGSFPDRQGCLSYDWHYVFRYLWDAPSFRECIEAAGSRDLHCLARVFSPHSKSRPMNLLRKLALSFTLILVLQTMAIPQEPFVKGSLPSVDLTAIVERPAEPGLAKGGAPIDRFSVDVALETARRRLLDPNAVACSDGRLVLEEIIVLFRVTDNERWTEAFAAYTAVVRPEDVSDRMVPEYVASLQMQPIGPGSLAAIKRIAELGPRARAALPALEWARSFSPDREQIEAATEAILSVRGRLKGLMTGC